MSEIKRKATRAVRIGSVVIGAGHPIAIQSMTATKTQDIDATVELVNRLAEAGAAIVRVAVDSEREAEALAEIRRQTSVSLSVDLQENYRLAERVAPHVDKIRYNPGHLYHHERHKPWQEKVRYLVQVAKDNDCAVRVGVNCGSVDPDKRRQFPPDDTVGPMVDSALEHCEFLDSLGFHRYCVSLKDSDPQRVVEANLRFAAKRPDVPLHLGVTEAGMPPEGIFKTRVAFEQLIGQGIGDTVRVSLTVPNSRKQEEVEAARKILADIAAGRFLASGEEALVNGLNIVSCPSCSRVQNEAFVELAEKVRQVTQYARRCPVTIAVMGCRVNGPGETDHADLGLWCGPKSVNLKRGPKLIGSFAYDEILEKLKEELDRLIEERGWSDKLSESE